jgi:hypothetical protein
MTDLARKICGIEPAIENATNAGYAEQAVYARRQDARTG